MTETHDDSADTTPHPSPLPSPDQPDSGTNAQVESDPVVAPAPAAPDDNVVTAGEGNGQLTRTDGVNSFEPIVFEASGFETVDSAPAPTQADGEKVTLVVVTPWTSSFDARVDDKTYRISSGLGTSVPASAVDGILESASSHGIAMNVKG